MKKYNPKVSIVIPVFNGEDYIIETINSILEQTYDNIECIVVNDGSTDATEELINKLDHRVVKFTTPNRGQSEAINFGFEKSSGDLVGYLSADDLIDNFSIKDLVELIIKENATNEKVVVFGKYRFIDSKGSYINKLSSNFSGGKDYLDYFDNKIGPGAIFSKQLFDECGGWDSDFKQIPDYVFWLKLLNHARFLQSEKVLSSFRVHDSSQTYAISSVDKANESIVLIDKIKKGEYFLASFADEKKFFASATVFSACLHIRSGRLTEGVSKWLTSMTMYSISISLSYKTMTRLLSCIYFYLKNRNI